VNNPHGEIPPTYVSVVLEGKVRVENPSNKALEVVRRLGGDEEFVAGSRVWSIPFRGDAELAKVFRELNGQGALFGSEPAGWPPAAVFRDLCKKGLLQRPFKEVTWIAPGKWVIRNG
jgi:hypothetical protein